MTISKNKLKYLKSLQLKKFRQKYNNFIVEGDKIARELLQSQSFEIEAVYAVDSWIETSKEELEAKHFPLFNISITDLKRISALNSPNQVFIVAKQAQMELDYMALNDQLMLYLDGIQDPGNLGTILRIADWFGIQFVFCSQDCVDLYNSKVLQSSMGAFLRVQCIHHDLKALADATQLPIYGTVLDGENIYATSIQKEGIIVVGNESKGIRQENKALLTKGIKIPSYNGGAESLNAAVATGIICSIFRSRE